MRLASVWVVLMACFYVTDGVTLDIELLDSSKDNCYKYVADGLDYLRITHARILELNKDDGTIITNIVCPFPKKKKDRHLLHAECQGSFLKVPNKKNLAYMLSVTALKPTMLSQIEYRYDEKTMELFKNGLVAPDLVANQSFDHERSIQVMRMIVNWKGNNGELQGISRYSSCLGAGLYPSSLISDHGIYTRMARASETRNVRDQWHRMYFEPDGIGEKLLLADDQ